VRLILKSSVGSESNLLHKGLKMKASIVTFGNSSVRYKVYKGLNRSQFKRFLSRLNLAGMDIITCRPSARRFNVSVKLP
jgi:hypothetical protein